ncbi:hypothetical protein [Embleya sp. NBC_00896]|uniref:hypothetical protein n=1 Tax=Embleya sp. NBC_00896 TaxID=2975961 RepID=UPI003864FCB1|nr:hypothetical protein OG928_45080 [Embleya sp. NBC_00896]
MAAVGHIDEAITAMGEDLAACRETGDHHEAGQTGEALAELWTRAGDTARAREARAGAAAEYTAAGAVEDARRVLAEDE